MMMRSGPSVATGGLLALWEVAGSSLTVWPSRTPPTCCIQGIRICVPVRGYERAIKRDDGQSLERALPHNAY